MRNIWPIFYGGYELLQHKLFQLLPEVDEDFHWAMQALFLSLVRIARRSVQTEKGLQMNRISYQLPEAARIAGVSRTRIFDAVRKQELTIRKAGRASIVTHDDLLAWIRSVPIKGKPQIAASLRDGRSA
jgi:hypothetical protein